MVGSGAPANVVPAGPACTDIRYRARYAYAAVFLLLEGDGMTHTTDCEFCAGERCAHDGGSIDDNPYPSPQSTGASGGQYDDPYWLWRTGFQFGEHLRDES